MTDLSKPLFPTVQLRSGNFPDDTDIGLGTVNDPGMITTIPPEHLLEFHFTHIQGDYSMQVSLVDPTYKRVEELLLAADNPNDKNTLWARFGFDRNISAGLTSPDFVPWLESPIINYSADVAGSGGMGITVSTGSRAFLMAATVKQEAKTGRISDIVKELAEENGYIADVVQTADASSSSYETKNMSQFSFILELAKKAVSVAGDENYIFSIDVFTNTLYFGPPKESLKPRESKWRIIYPMQNPQELTDKDLLCTRYNPDIPGNALGSIAAEKTIVRFVDSETKEPISLSLTPELIKGFVSGDKSQIGNPTLENTPNTARAIVPAAGVGEVAPREWIRNFQSLYRNITKATAECIGTPNALMIQPDDLVDVFMVIPTTGDLHYTSGQWKILRAQHDIIQGAYQISLELTKDAIKGIAVVESYGKYLSDKTEFSDNPDLVVH